MAFHHGVSKIAPPFPQKTNVYHTDKLNIDKEYNFQCNAFIDKNIGKALEQHFLPYKNYIANYTDFLNKIKNIGGTWGVAPFSAVPDYVIPGLNCIYTFFNTNDRTFGGGESKVAVNGKFVICVDEIGDISFNSKTFNSTYINFIPAQSKECVVQILWIDGNKCNGYVYGPDERNAIITQKPFEIHNFKAYGTIGSETAELPNNCTEISTGASSSYPFSILAPDIDIYLKIKATRIAGSYLDICISGKHNLFPFYECIINNEVKYMYKPKATGPGLYNLNVVKPFEIRFTERIY
jgi:hypothetical protein